MEWFIKGFKNYANFKGRARRKEYWMFYLFYMIFLALLATVADITDTTISYVIFGIYFLGTLIPVFAVNVRRLHDIGKSGWFLLTYYIPIVGTIFLLVSTCTDSQPGDNKYGPNPKENQSSAA
ncbi:DUF805 domain-containing protein [Bacillus massilinigeriensis]|uniref:DUF805 domain-containing protein n=1 Tax=Bacillus mediterraneensis TaxID=1805474 RepID=UPI0008F95D2C|nr:DUF805 domain-containing protein [Bacillus mediterraneensis]